MGFVSQLKVYLSRLSPGFAGRPDVYVECLFVHQVGTVGEEVTVSVGRRVRKQVHDRG